jgi:hypothetical protein
MADNLFDRLIERVGRRARTTPALKRHPSLTKEGSQFDFGFWVLDWG